MAARKLQKGERPPTRLKELVLRLAGRDPRPTNRDIQEEVARKFEITIDNRTISRYCQAAGLPTSSRPSQEGRGQNDVDLAPWVLSAQEKHLEGDFQGGQLVTGGVRQHLESFQGAFRNIDPDSRSYYVALVASEFIDEVHCHLPDEQFWEWIERFARRSGEAAKLLEDLDQEIRINAEQQVAPVAKTGRDNLPQITSHFVTKVVSLALAPHLGETWEASYQWVEPPSQPPFLELGNLVIARGIQAQAAHREFAERYRDDARILMVASLMGNLQTLREQILQRIRRCLYEREYVHHFCPSCPARRS